MIGQIVLHGPYVCLIGLTRCGGWFGSSREFPIPLGCRLKNRIFDPSDLCVGLEVNICILQHMFRVGLWSCVWIPVARD